MALQCGGSNGSCTSTILVLLFIIGIFVVSVVGIFVCCRKARRKVTGLFGGASKKEKQQQQQQQQALPEQQAQLPFESRFAITHVDDALPYHNRPVYPPSSYGQPASPFHTYYHQQGDAV